MLLGIKCIKDLSNKPSSAWIHSYRDFNYAKVRLQCSYISNGTYTRDVTKYFAIEKHAVILT